MATQEEHVLELDLAVAVAEVYRSDPSFTARGAVWDRLAAALPTLLSAGAARDG